MWSFSFSLIGHYLSGQVDMYLAIFLRLLLGFLTLLPFVKRESFFSTNYLKTLVIGAIQVGLMYICYFGSFRYLRPAEVALFATGTPFYIYLLTSIHTRCFSWKALPAIFLVILGTMLIKFKGANEGALYGFFLVQGANILFALGQVLYKYWLPRDWKDNHSLSNFSAFNLGAVILMIPLVLLFSDFTKLPETRAQFLSLLWLGVGASGIGYYLWNTGVKKVNNTIVAIMNNAYVPGAVIVEFFIWKSDLDIKMFLLGLAFMMTSIVYTQIIIKKI
jgi:carboxylate/amino acid/amine transporter